VIKMIAKITDAVNELRLALVQVREMIAALENLIAAPDLATFEKFRKEAADVVASVKTKGI